jgi:hypothetical protein
MVNMVAFYQARGTHRDQHIQTLGAQHSAPLRQTDRRIGGQGIAFRRQRRMHIDHMRHHRGAEDSGGK